MATVSFNAYAITADLIPDGMGDFDEDVTSFANVTLSFVVSGDSDSFSYTYDFIGETFASIETDGPGGDTYSSLVNGAPVNFENGDVDLVRIGWGSGQSTDLLAFFFEDFSNPNAPTTTSYIVEMDGSNLGWNSAADFENWLASLPTDSNGDLTTVSSITSGPFAEGADIPFASLADFVSFTQNDVVDASQSGSTDFYLGSGNDVFTGDGARSRVWDGSGNDTVNLGGGNDYVRVGGGQDSFDGGSGSDWISYYSSSGGVNLNLATGTASGSWASNDTVVNFESVTGSKNGSDTIRGTDGANDIRTYGGNDKVYAGKGADDVRLGAGNDYVLVGGGAESFDGGTGSDYISYYNSTGGIRINLGRDEVSGSWAVNDTIKDFESAAGSKSGSDTMIGSSAANTMRGYGGNDKFWGGSGSDKLYGGTGNDWFDGGGGSGTDLIWGGADSDTFHFDKGDGTDIIKDFENNIDIIELDNFGFSAATAFGFADQVGADVVFDFGSDGMLTIENVTIGQLQNDLFMV